MYMTNTFVQKGGFNQARLGSLAALTSLSYFFPFITLQKFETNCQFSYLQKNMANL